MKLEYFIIIIEVIASCSLKPLFCLTHFEKLADGGVSKRDVVGDDIVAWSKRVEKKADSPEWKGMALSGKNPSRFKFISKKRRKRQDLITVPSRIVKPPMIVVLPATTPSDGECQQSRTTEKIVEKCYECPGEKDAGRLKPIDSPFMIECCPADFQPRSPQQEDDCLVDKSSITSKPPNAYIYSCKWQGKRHVEEEVFSVPLDPPAIKISLDPKSITKYSIPIKVSLEEK